jgi:hypothetical protein
VQPPGDANIITLTTDEIVEAVKRLEVRDRKVALDRIRPLADDDLDRLERGGIRDAAGNVVGFNGPPNSTWRNCVASLRIASAT